MSQSFYDFLKTFGAAYAQGDFQQAATLVALPAPIYSNGEVQVVKTRHELATRLSDCQATARHLGCSKLDLSLVRAEARKGRGCAKVRCTGRTRDGTAVSFIDVTYFCEESSAKGWMISMTEISDNARL